MSTKRTLFIALVGAYSLLLSYSGAWAWQANIHAGWASSVVVDAAGNVIAAGSIENNGTGSAFTVIKFNGVTGAETWSRIINGTIAGSDNSANAITLDGAGNVVVAGVTNQIAGEEGGDSSFGDFTVIKFSGADGTELWRQVIDGSGTNSFGSANAVAVDRAGNVVAAGRSRGSLGDFTVVKYNGATGAELWRRVLTGSVPIGDCADSAGAVTVDGEGNVVASGFLCNAPPLEFIPTVIKFNGVTGQELWRQVGGVGTIAIDAAGNVVAAGSIPNFSTFTSALTTIKFNGATGAELWRQVINGTANAAGSSNAAQVVAVDAQGNVVAAGFSTNNGTGRDFTVIKFNGATGAELWRQVINDADNNANALNRAAARALAIDAQGNVVAAGSTVNNGTVSDFTAIKFDGVTGAEVWRQVINGTSNASGSASAVAVDARGNVVAAGSTGSDFTVVKFNGRATAVDFDGDGESDIGVYYNGTWYLQLSTGSQTILTYGGATDDILVPGDYDGDGKTDIAVFLAGTWYILQSSDGGQRILYWGGAGNDIPVPTDYDGDGKTDLAVYRAGSWYIARSLDEGLTALGWGLPDDKPVPADYDGDGKADITVYRDGLWFIIRSSDGGQTVVKWGTGNDTPVPGDYDGDGKADLAVFQGGIWNIVRSSDGQPMSFVWGFPADIPVPADFDGDGKTDLAVYRAGLWIIFRSSDGMQTAVVYGGATGAIPLH